MAMQPFEDHAHTVAFLYPSVWVRRAVVTA
jgi:hypothetical protein